MSAQSLFDIARDDGPPADRRDAMWDQIATATGAGAAVSAAAAMKAPAAAASSAGGVATTILATIGTAIVALALSAPDSSGRADAPPRVTTPAAQISPTGDVRPPRPAPPEHARPAPTSDVHAPAGDVRVRVSTPVGPVTTIGPATHAPAPRPAATARAAESGEPGDALSHEADLVSRARTALRAGDASTALTLARRARSEGARALEPEEMKLEARALRALGRADEAAAVEVALRLRHPGHALAR